MTAILGISAFYHDSASALIIDGEKHYEVKWKNHKKTTFEPRKILNQDVPKMIKQFETKNKIDWNNLYS